MSFFYSCGAQRAFEDLGFEKVAVGTRQLRRILQALAEQPLPKQRARFAWKQKERELLDAALKKIRGKTPEVRMRKLEEVLAQRHSTGYPMAMGKEQLNPVERLYQRLQERFAPEYAMGEGVGLTHQQLAGALRHADELSRGGKKEFMRHLKEHMREVGTIEPRVGPSIRTTGRHRPEEVVQRVLPTEDVKVIDTGRIPDVLWRGAERAVVAKPTTPIWFSGIPEVSAGYASRRGGGSGGLLRAYDYSKVPASMQGPFTPHIAVNPMTTSPKKVQRLIEEAAKRRRLGAHSKYEKVVQARAAKDMPLVSEYRVLPQDVRDLPHEMFTSDIEPALPITLMLRRGKPIL